MQNDQPPAQDTLGSTNERLRQPGKGVIDQRQQQIDPAGDHRVDPNARPDANRKQPGGSDPETENDNRGAAQ